MFVIPKFLIAIPPSLLSLPSNYDYRVVVGKCMDSSENLNAIMPPVKLFRRERDPSVTRCLSTKSPKYLQKLPNTRRFWPKCEFPLTGLSFWPKSKVPVSLKSRPNSEKSPNLVTPLVTFKQKAEASVVVVVVVEETFGLSIIRGWSRSTAAAAISYSSPSSIFYERLPSQFNTILHVCFVCSLSSLVLCNKPIYCTNLI